MHKTLTYTNRSQFAYKNGSYECAMTVHSSDTQYITKQL